jgi:dTDP-4-dehydrorhamnose 3,5-epimerase
MATEAVTIPEDRKVARTAGLDLVLPECEKGIGSVILKADSPQLIDGVRIEPVTLWPDDRGYFLEVQRLGRGLAVHFPRESTQISAALSYPGTIKAFHYHMHQTDCWAPVTGSLQVALVDLRMGSVTHGARNTLYVGVLRPWRILIPPGVAHGYKVIGPDQAMLVYLTDRLYDASDEGRIPYNDSHIQYDWEMQHK